LPIHPHPGFSRLKVVLFHNYIGELAKRWTPAQKKKTETLAVPTDTPRPPKGWRRDLADGDRKTSSRSCLRQLKRYPLYHDIYWSYLIYILDLPTISIIN
jgi:hypothetical protein